MTVYYNEIDLGVATWLRNLIAAGLIADGVVDTRSIEDVRPDELREFTQCHFFAGLGGWSRALRAAGWADDRPVWTGSCPCQPFSQAGEGLAFADERHLWPAFYHLIGGHAKWCRQQKRPVPAIFGEQVASKVVDDWIDLVHADMEALGYAFGSVPFPSAGVGAPHIRDRNYWAGIMADPDNARLEGWRVPAKRAAQRAAGKSGVVGGLAHPSSRGSNGRPETAGCEAGANSGVAGSDDFGGMADTNKGERGPRRPRPLEAGGAHGEPTRCGIVDAGLPGPANGFWRGADWLGCTDGKWRPVEPGTFPLANGIPARVVRLRAYGNAINVEAARAWIECVMEDA